MSPHPSVDRRATPRSSTAAEGGAETPQDDGVRDPPRPDHHVPTTTVTDTFGPRRLRASKLAVDERSGGLAVDERW